MIGAILLLPLAFAGDDEEDDEAFQRAYDFSGVEISGEMLMPSASYGATPGGAQDIAFFRDRVEAGEIPLPEVFTAEGLFSEHDLPLAAGPCDRLLCANTRAIEARMLVQPDVRWLAQVGFDSGLTPETFHRAPLDLVAVVDKSGSMSGQIEMVKASLRKVLSELGPGDRMAIVAYGADVATVLPSTSAADRSRILAGIDAIEIDGSTNMEAGLLRGFALARAGRRTFDGTSRVMLFTDERPNTGATDADSFMGLALAASRDGIGMTTIGVGVQFGAELAQEISSVRGGNLFFFPDSTAMEKRFAEDFDTMVTELAYDLDLDVQPADGLRIAGVYGVPGDLVTWTEDGGIHLHVSTLFLSRSAGALYVAFGPESDGGRVATRSVGEDLGRITIAYDPRDGVRTPVTSSLSLIEPTRGDAGLRRGAALVDEATTLKKATALHHQNNDQEGAWQLVHALVGRLVAERDPDLAPEIALVERLDETLGRLAGHEGERPSLTSQRDPVTGLPIR